MSRFAVFAALGGAGAVGVFAVVVTSWYLDGFAPRGNGTGPAAVSEPGQAQPEAPPQTGGAAARQPAPGAEPDRSAALQQPEPEAQPRVPAEARTDTETGARPGSAPAPDPAAETETGGQMPIAPASDGAAPEPEQKPAPEPAPEPEAAPDPSALPPVFDLVRADPGAPVIVAGQGWPGALIEVLVDGRAEAEAAVATDGKFVAFVDLPLTDAPRILSLRMTLGEDSLLSEEEIIVAPIPAPVKTAQQPPVTAPDAGTAAATAPPAEQPGGSEAPVALALAGADRPDATSRTTAGSQAVPQAAGDGGTSGQPAGPLDPASRVRAEGNAAPDADAGTGSTAPGPGTVSIAADAEPDKAGAAQPTASQPAASSVSRATDEAETVALAPVVPDSQTVAPEEAGLTGSNVDQGGTPVDAQLAPVRLSAGEPVEAAGDQDVSGAQGGAMAGSGEESRPATGGGSVETAQAAEQAASAAAAARQQSAAAAGDVAPAKAGSAAPPPKAPRTAVVQPGLSAPATQVEQPQGIVQADEDVPQAFSPATGGSAPRLPDTPAIIRSGPRGIEVLPTAPLAPGGVALDAITYDDSGAVQLAGRGAEAGFVRVYLDNAPLAVAEVGSAGRWAVTLPQVDTGTYTLRVDQIGSDGVVTARVESPFLRESPETLAAASAAAQGPVSTITVQPGNTLWAIARQRYGKGIEYVKVFDANRDRIRDPDLIYPGQIFDLPQQ